MIIKENIFDGFCVQFGIRKQLVIAPDRTCHDADNLNPPSYTMHV